MRNRDHLLGPPDSSSQPPKARWLLSAAFGFVLACLVVGAYLLGRNESAESKSKDDAAAPTVKSQVERAPESSQKLDPKAFQNARPTDTTADFIITDRLLKNQLSWEDFQEEAISTSVCIGKPIRIANAAARTVGLVDTPEESDATASIGIVRAGEIMTITPLEVGTFYISEADADGMLFRYEAKSCQKKTA